MQVVWANSESHFGGDKYRLRTSRDCTVLAMSVYINLWHGKFDCQIPSSRYQVKMKTVLCVVVVLFSSACG